MNHLPSHGRLLAPAICAAVLGPLCAQAWDPAGHMLVGQIAWDQSTPAVRAKVTELVRKLPNEYNAGQPYNFVTAPCWMDDERAMPKYPWSKWHYVTIPWTPDGKDFALPEPPHVVWAIDTTLQALRDPATTPEKQVEALAMVLHFVGDIQQPLHATDRNQDRGGNGFLLSGMTMVSYAPGRPVKPATLHYLWDSAYRLGFGDAGVVDVWAAPAVGMRPAPGDGGVITVEAAKIETDFPAESLPELADANAQSATAWARESHCLGCLFGYPKGEEPSDMELHPIPGDFVKKAHEIAVRRIALGGYRLAKVLNEIFAEK